jgi:pimeloyl-ACP methyl ester carboxylesterase
MVAHLVFGRIATAYCLLAGRLPAIVLLPGYMSDMGGNKALAVEAWAAGNGQTCLRLDYSGCGASGGDFADGSISRWTADVAAVLDHCGIACPVLVGSSMGGWIALRLALTRPVSAVVGIAAAPDFPDWGLPLSAADHVGLAQRGYIERPSAYGSAPYRYTRTFLDDAVASRVLTGSIAVDAPVRLLHGQADPDVPWQLSLDVAAQLRSVDVQVLLVKDGDHRLSRPQDLALLTATLEGLLETL